MRKTSRRESHAFALLVAANPVDVDDVRRELNEGGLAAAPARAMGALPARRRAVPDRRLGMAGAAAGAMAALTAVGLLVLLQGGAEPASAMEVLNAAARVAAREPEAAPGPGQYVYIKERSGVVGGRSETVEWWIASDGSGRMVRHGPPATGIWSLGNGQPRERHATVVGGRRTAGTVRFGPGRFADLYARMNPGILGGHVDGLPTNAASLAPLLRRELGRAGDFNPDPGAHSLQMLQVLEEILANPLASPGLRSAVYKVAAGLEGVRIEQDAVDPAGRRATAVALCSPAIPAHYKIFFDPITSATLAMREVSPAACDGVSSGPSGLTSFTVYSKEAIVGSIHERP